jgi:outer membrane protein OmpA-like peptidoglycan-associated protein
MRRNLFPVALLGILIALAHDAAVAQSPEGRWSVGLSGGGNVWIADYNTLKIGAGGSIALRYGATSFLSIGLQGGFEELKTENDVSDPSFAYSYLRLSAIPFALMTYFHVPTTKSFYPYLYLGGGAMIYQRYTSNKAPAPDENKHTTYIVPVGLGLEAMTSDNFSITLEAGYTNLSNSVDLRENSSPDGYATAKVGVHWYFGQSGPIDSDLDSLTDGQEARAGTDPKNPDSDGDGLKDGEELRNYRTNPLRPDTDADGLKDGEEVTQYSTNPTRYDTDGDGLPDGEEATRYRTDPARPDSDGDGLSDGDEALRFKTDPLKVDSDGDGLSDWDELRKYRSDPLNADTDGDGITDGEEILKYKTDPIKPDTDSGGLIDGAEVIRGTNPLDPRDDVIRETMPLQRGQRMVFEGITFASGTARLTPESEASLQKLYNALVMNPALRVEIAGYTDNTGSRATNMKISQQRADAVRNWLIAKGIAASRLSARGYGPADPVDTNTTAGGRANNRRVELHVQ